MPCEWSHLVFEIYLGSRVDELFVFALSVCFVGDKKIFCPRYVMGLKPGQVLVLIHWALINDLWVALVGLFAPKLGAQSEDNKIKTKTADCSSPQKREVSS